MGDSTSVRVTSIIEERGRVYVQKKKYVTLHVFTKSQVEADLLCQALGGGMYAHGVGFVWVLGDRKALVKLTGDLSEKHKLHEVLDNTK